MKCPDCGHNNIAGEELCEQCGSSLYEFALPRPKSGVQKRVLDGIISDLKPHDAVSVAPSQTVAEAVQSMRQHNMCCVLVMQKTAPAALASTRISARRDSTKENDLVLVGICTERDILFHVAGIKNPAKTKISEVMKPSPQYLKETDSVAFAFNRMGVQGYRHIPVARQNGGFGIISSRDLLAYLCR